MRAFLRCLAFSALVLHAGLVAAQDAIPWARSIEEAQRQAAQQQRLVLIHFYGDNCPPCRALEANVFPRPEFARGLTSNYVPVKINATQNRELAARYGIRQWPTDVVITPDGKPLIAPTVSPQDPVKYLAMLDQVAAEHRVRVTPTAGNTYEQVASAPSYEARPVAHDMPADSRWTPPSQQQQPQGSSNYASPYGANAGGALPRQDSPYGGAQPQQGPYNPSGYGQTAADRNSAYRPNLPEPGQAYVEGTPYRNPQSEMGRSPYDLGGSPDAGRGLQSQASDAVYGRPSDDSYLRRDVRLSDSGSFSPQQPPVQQPSLQQPVGQPRTGQPLPQLQTNPHAGRSAADVAQHRPAPPTGNSPPLALDGYCPVALLETGKWVKGDIRFGAIHRGRTYLFATAAEQQKFLATPDKFSPMLSGYDPVKYIEEGVLVEGKREHGLHHDEHMYLFVDEASLQKFWKSPMTYAPTVRQAMQQSIVPNVRR